MNCNSIFCIAIVLSLLSFQVFSCAINRVIFTEEMEIDGTLVKIVVLDSRQMKELVISMQEPGNAIRESVFRINWMPDIVEIDDYNDDSMLDVKIVSTIGETQYFYGTEMAFIDIF